ncbi:MAG: hypothetical protein ICV85_16240 [Tolypothrix sp. T3-bin4]|nr:hypothetical protein [Tolypothrix sp. Co-bin9]MBD0303652.1 hypothetical protein [Tolypothrix sp. T3-bin4]
MAAKKLPSQSQSKAQPKQTFVALKPLKKQEDTSPAPFMEVASEPVVDAPIVPKSNKKKSVVSATHVNKTLEPVALNAIAPSAVPEAIAPPSQELSSMPIADTSNLHKSKVSAKRTKKTEQPTVALNAVAPPSQEVTLLPIADTPTVHKTKVSATPTNYLEQSAAQNTIAPSAEPEAIAPTAQDSTANPQKSKPSHQPIFQGIGILVGQIKFTENQGFVVVKGKEYPLLFAHHRRKFYDELRSQIESDNGEPSRLIVYPKITHFPKREKPYHVGFQLVSLDKGCATNGISQQLQDFEFKLCGLWQFIPACQTPCISVFKNFSSERLTYIKQIEKDKKVRYLKASHIPVMWRGDTKPFRFNPKLTALEQGHPTFVEVIAKFEPGHDVFEFSKLLAEPTEKAPNFLKAGKKDKAEASQLKKQRENSSKASIESS